MIKTHNRAINSDRKERVALSTIEMRFVFLTIILVTSTPIFASQEIFGEFSTVTGSDCISEIHFFKNGRGVFIDYCNGATDASYKTNISWKVNNNIVHTAINGIDEAFTFQSKLSCSYIGKSGSSAGLVGMDLYFWKKPVKCK